MSYQITIQPSGATFTSEADETLLEAALRQGLIMPYGCKDGACGACKGTLKAGTVDLGRYQAHALSAEEIEAGQVLLCTSKATSDLTLENRQVVKAGAIPVKTLPGRIEKLEKLAPDVIAMHLRLPASEKFVFHAGQYIDFLLKDGKRRSYSLANAPEQEGTLELHIRLVPGGLFTEQVFGTLKVKDILRFEGPHGGFFLREESTKPAILLASGTGFAPIKSIIGHALAQDSRRPLHLYWGGRTQADLYMPTLPEDWAGKYPHIRYTPVLSEPEPGWSGRTGFVHRAVMEDYPSLAGHQVYACGAPVMIDAARKDFVAQCALPEEEFYSDAFTFSAPGM